MPTLDVPHFSQLVDGYCLPACAQIVLTYLGVVCSQEDLAQQMGSRPIIGTPRSRLTRLQSREISVALSVGGDLETMRQNLERQLPVIISIQTAELSYWHGHASRHAVVVVGIEDQDAKVLDPAFPASPVSVPLDELMLAWDEMDNAYAVLSRR